MREKTNALFVKQTVILVKHELSRGSVDDHGIYCGLQGRKKLLAIYSRERGGKKSILCTKGITMGVNEAVCAGTTCC